MLPHVENDEHALLAMGWLWAELERTKEVPTSGEWLEWWEKALDYTRARAHRDPLSIMTTGQHVTTNKAEPDAQKIPLPQPESPSEPAESEQVRPEDQQAIKYKDDVAQSDNVVSLMNCSVEGCHNKIPTSKGIPVCYEHEPRPTDASDVEVADE